MVSVIIPNYNHARFLEERIQSVLNQTYQDFEITILDDCSTDNSIEVINQYRNHPKVTDVVVNEQNSGSPFKQWQKGISMAKGDIIWIAESDDTCEPTFLETLVKEYKDNNPVLAFCRSKCIDERGNQQENNFQNVFKEDFVLDGNEFIRRYLSVNSYVQNISSAIFSKNAAIDIKSDYTEYRGAGDWLFAIELSQKGRVVYIHEALNYYRIHVHSTTNSERENGNGAKEIKCVCDYLKRNRFVSTKQYRIFRWNRIRQIHFGYSRRCRQELLTMWDTNIVEKCILQMLSIYNYLLLVKKKVISWSHDSCSKLYG